MKYVVDGGAALCSEIIVRGFTVTGGVTLSGGEDTESFISYSEHGLRVRFLELIAFSFLFVCLLQIVYTLLITLHC